MAGTDLELLMSARAGDAEAFGHLVARHQRLVRAVALGATGDPGMSEEIAQEAFVTAWVRLHELRESQRFTAWVCGIARNLARYTRRHQGRHAPAANEPVERLAELPADVPSPLDTAIGAQERTILRDALGRIPKNYREPLVLFYGEDQSIAEVALHLGISRDAVKQRLSRGRTYLRRGVRHMIETTLSRPSGAAGMSAAVLATIAALPEAAAGAGVASTLGLGASSVGASGLGMGMGMALGTVVAACLTLAAVVLVPRASEWSAASARPGSAWVAPAVDTCVAPYVPVFEEPEALVSPVAPAPAAGVPVGLEVAEPMSLEPVAELEFAPVTVPPRAIEAIGAIEDRPPTRVRTALPPGDVAPQTLAASVVEHGPSSVSRPSERPALSFLDALDPRAWAEPIQSERLPAELLITPPDMTARIVEAAD